MTFDSLFSDLTSVTEYFLNIFTQLMIFVNSHPLLILSLYVTVTLPAILLIFYFVSDLAFSSDEVTSEGFGIYKNIKKNEKNKKAKQQREAFQREKVNKQVRAYEIAQTFFANNPDVMSISIMGHKFYQSGFEHENWSNRRRNSRQRSSFTSSKNDNSSSATHQGSSANIDVEVDDE